MSKLYEPYPEQYEGYEEYLMAEEAYWNKIDEDYEQYKEERYEQRLNSNTD